MKCLSAANRLAEAGSGSEAEIKVLLSMPLLVAESSGVAVET